MVIIQRLTLLREAMMMIMTETRHLGRTWMRSSRTAN